jgi:molybdopterin molybdotransferase
MALLSVTEALARVTEGLVPLDAERVPLGECRGRVLADDLAACLTQPPFDASAMDGYAVRAEDVAVPPATLRLIGESSAGSGYDGEVAPGEAVRIFTGAPVPKGADTVVIQEDTDAAPGVVIVKEAAPHRHIRPRGQDFTVGEVLLRAGVRLGPRELMLAAAMNHAELPVRRKPKVAILATGDEVVPPGTELARDQVVSSVPAGLAALIEAKGGEPMSLGIAKDTAESLITLARTGSAADILVTIGGASVGERDLVSAALRSEGLELDFWKIAMRPGKPLLFGRLGATPVLGLPGNPVSSLVCATIFLKPALELMLGLPPSEAPRASARLGRDLPQNDRRQDYLRSRLARDASGGLIATPFPVQDSSMLSRLAWADCLVLRPPLAPPARAGDEVEIIELGGGSLSI